MDVPEIDELFEKLRKAGNGAIIKLDASNKGHLVEGIIVEPGPLRPAGYESGIFVKVPTEATRLYYLDPEASREQGKIIMQMLEVTKEIPPLETLPEDLLREYDHVRAAPEVKLGGGAMGQAISKNIGTIEMGKHNNNEIDTDPGTRPITQ